ncbi:spore coat protein CotJB [Bacillus horti]|uniref:Spore coat protein JB n=1 Tax=Caldalkalibacillus horti TaxID=77523 RepID=A0ABT9VYC1_9BACI|nr:spore coat protein CotJB [Bacillus horti]MDQ0165997.1 spore coat protein JB [Bacillus horti]
MTKFDQWTTEEKEKYHKLLEEIQVVDFVLVELNLYLNTHPQDFKAIQQYNDLTEQSMLLKNQFTEIYGPLVHFGNDFSKYPWTWKEAPWPWQV